MPFTDAIRNISLRQSILSAECLKSDQVTWASSSIDLNEILGNVDGKFVLGGKGFAQFARDINLVNQSLISAKLRNTVGNYVDATFDLGVYLYSKDGVIVANGGGLKQLVLPNGLERSVSTGSAVSTATSASISSASSQSTSMTSVSQSSSSSTFKSASFKRFNQQLLLEETCSNFVLKGTYFHCDFRNPDGSLTHVILDLDLHVGNVDGRLVWDASGFSKTSSTFVLDGFWLVAKCRVPGLNTELTTRLDLRTRLRIQGSDMIVIQTNKQLSMMLSEVPWMKFKVIAQPDLSVFSKHPVVQQTMMQIAESTIEHVTTEMHKMLTAAMEAAIVAITASAMKHVSMQMEQTIQDAVGVAAASPSATEAEFLHISAAAGLYGSGYSSNHGYSSSMSGNGAVTVSSNSQMNTSSQVSSSSQFTSGSQVNTNTQISTNGQVGTNGQINTNGQYNTNGQITTGGKVAGQINGQITVGGKVAGQVTAGAQFGGQASVEGQISAGGAVSGQISAGGQIGGQVSAGGQMNGQVSAGGQMGGQISAGGQFGGQINGGSNGHYSGGVMGAMYSNDNGQVNAAMMSKSFNESGNVSTSVSDSYYEANSMNASLASSQQAAMQQSMGTVNGSYY